jgi:hypothetical protein
MPANDVLSEGVSLRLRLRLRCGEPVKPAIAAMLVAAVLGPVPLRAQSVSPAPLPSTSPAVAVPAPVPSGAQDAPYAFAPPQGWQPMAPDALPISARGMVAIWVAPAPDARGFRPNITIMREVAATKTMSFETITAFERVSLERMAGAGNVKEHFAGACAPGAKNESYVSHVTLGAMTLHIEQIVSVGSVATYVVTYEYVEGSAPDVPAEAAVNAFCSSAIPLS